MGRDSLLAVCVVASAFGAANAKTDKKETTPKTWVVDASHGTFSERVRIEVPAFREITPNLALTYDSSDGNGWVGVGWSLEGVGVVERASPGKGAPKYNSTDIYLLDGEELVPCAGGSVSPSCTTGGTHSTKVENYLRIALTGTGQGSRWTVTLKNGTRRVYAPIYVVNGGADVYKWGLAQVIDTKGNTVTYSWAVNLFGCCWEYPQSVSYNGTTVTFHYEQRPDRVSGAVGAGMRTVLGRIKTIDVTVSGSRLRTYKLSYVASGPTSRSLLASVQQFGTDATVDASGSVTGGSSLPPITMQYQGGAPAFAQGTEERGVSSSSDADYFAIDINGDGRTDMLEVYRVCVIVCWRYRVAWISNGSEYAQASSETGMSTGTKTRLLPMDVNGDGKGDVVELYESWGSMRRRVWLSDGTRFNQASDGCCMKSTSDDARYFAMDVNGDGKSDLVELYQSVWFQPEGRRVWFSNGSAFTEGPSQSLDHDKKWLYLSLDVNGDGKADMVQLKDWYGAVQRTTWLSTGTGFSAAVVDYCDGQVVEQQQDGVVTEWSPFLPMDVNGDGKDDLVNLAAFFGNRVRRVWHSTGSAFTEVSEVTVPFYDAGDWFLAMDINGDGRSDLVSIESIGLGIEQRQIWLSVGDNFVAGATDTQSAFGEGTKLVAADVDGDGLSEMVTLDSFFGIRTRRIWKMNGPYPDLLTSIRGSLGATTRVSYTPSSAWENTNNPPLVQTATAVTLDDGRGGIATTHYAYAGGLYDRLEKRFLGFRYEKETRPCIAGEQSCPYNETWFRQDYGAASKPERIDHRAGSGQLLKAEIYEYTTNGATLPWTSLRTGNWEYTYVGSGGACPGSQCKRKYVSRTFNAYGDVTVEVDHGHYDASGDEDTRVNTFVPNTSAYIVNKPADVKTFAGAGTGGALLTETLTYYDGAVSWNVAPSAGLPTKEARWLSSPSSFVETRKEYDAWGNVTAEINALGTRKQLAYDATYHIFAIAETNALGQVTSTSWNTVCGEKSQIIDLNGQPTSMTYDPLCRLAQKTEPGGNFERHAWVGLGDATSQYELIETPAADGGGTPMWSREYFDGHKRIWRKVKQGPAASGNIYVDTGYNARGEETSKTRPYYWASGPQPPTYTTRTDYDALDRPIRVTHPDGSYKTTSYNLWSTTETDELGRSRINDNDADGRRVAHKEHVDGTYAVTTYVYDARGNLAQSIDPHGNAITYVNDSLGRTIAMTDPDWGTWSYAFDGADRMTAQTDAKGQRTEFTYDVLDRKTSKTSNAGTGAAATVTWAYDQIRSGYHNLGKLTSMTDGAGAKTLDYDVAGRTVKTVRIMHGTSYTFLRGFDAGGRARWTTYPDGDTLGTPGAPLGYDVAGRLTSIPGYVTSVVYNADDEVTRLDSANGAVSIRSYSAVRGWLTGITTTSGATTIQNLVYTRNAKGLISQVTSPIANEGWTYEYDELDRLVSASNTSDPTQNQTLTYDAIGNITFNSRLGNYSYGSSRPHAVTAAGSNSYTYDAAGLMTSGAGRTIGWDGDNRLVSVTGAGTHLAYTYDADGARIQQVENASTRRFFGDNFELEVGGATRKYIMVADVVVARRAGTTSYWVHTDHLGSFQAETDASGNEAHRKKYRPYGEILSSTGTLDDEPRGYTGQRHDASGLIDLHNRSYDPTLGRFISPDLVIDGEDTVGLNRYAYCSNNPITRTDVEGTDDEPEPDKDKKPEKKAQGNWITRGVDAAKRNGEFADEPPTIGEPGQDKVRYDFYQKPVAVAGSHFKAVVTDESGKNVGTYSLAGWDAKYNDTSAADGNYRHAGTIYKSKESLQNFNDAFMNIADGNRYAVGDSNAAIDHAIKAIGEPKGIFTVANPHDVPAAAYGYNNFEYRDE